MDKENKGLADKRDGEFILNESGTSVNTSQTNEDNPEKPPAEQHHDSKPGAEDSELLKKFGHEEK